MLKKTRFCFVHDHALTLLLSLTPCEKREKKEKICEESGLSLQTD